MTVFCCLILKAINGYKAALKKSLTLAEYTAKMHKLGIKRSYIKNADEVKLYKIGLKVVSELEQLTYTSKREKSVNFYYGEEECLQYLKKLLTEYRVEDGEVINVAQKSSCVLVTAIQLIAMVKDKLEEDVAQQIYQCSRFIAKYGSKEQKKVFNKAITSNQLRHSSLFFRQLQNFVSCLDES